MDKPLNLDKTVLTKAYEDGIEKLVEWANKKHVDVQFGYKMSDEYRPADSLITINTHYGLENRLYALLHECGHLLLTNNEKSYVKKYPSSARMWYYTRNRRIENSKKYKVDVISEEIDAWRKGREIAKRLNIYVDDKNYYSLMTDCVYTYISHLGRR